MFDDQNGGALFINFDMQIILIMFWSKMLWNGRLIGCFKFGLI